MATSLQEAQQLADRGDYIAAEARCQEAVETEDTRYDAFTLLGHLMLVRGDPAGAESNYRKAISLRPGEIGALEGLARVQLGTDRLTECAGSYRDLVGRTQGIAAVAKEREFRWRLAEVIDKMGDAAAAVSELHQLLQLPMDTQLQKLEALCFLADLQRKVEWRKQGDRLDQYLSRQSHPNPAGPKRSRSALRLQVDAERADEQLAEDHSLAKTLRDITSIALPSPRFAGYFEMHLQTYLSRLGVHPPRSAARQEKRMDAMRECVSMISTSAGGCTTPFPFEAAIWLLEEQEELYGGTFPVRAGEDKARLPGRQRSVAVQTQLRWYRGNSIHRMSFDKLNVRRVTQEPTIDEDGRPQDTRPVATRHESFGVKLAHQFPWLGSASAAIGLALRRRFLSDPDAPSTALRRRQISTALQRGMDAGANSAAGWRALAELQYQNRQWQAAYNTASRGLEWSARRRQAGHETLTGFALSLRLCLARCLRRLDRLEEGEAAFKTLAGWTTDGEGGFNELSGSPPTSIRQQALRGLAKIALQRGERDAAKAQYERLLGKALIGRGRPAEHWAHAEYAWLQFEDGCVSTARIHLEKALEVADQEGCSVTDSEIAEHHFRLGRVLWDIGGAAREDPGQARRHFEAASLEDSDFQEQACVWLGRWYEEIAIDYNKAKNCYEEALLLDPLDHATATLLKRVDEELGLEMEAVAAANLAAAAADGTIQRSAFETRSTLPFSHRGPEVDKLLSSITDKKSLERSNLQSAHSANSELAGYWTVRTK